MEKQIWIDSKRDVCREYDQKEYDFLIEYAQENQRNILAKWKDESHLGIKKTLRYGSSIVKKFEHHIQARKNLSAIFCLGALMGTIRSFEHLSFEETQNQWIDRTFRKEVFSIKNLDRVIRSLEIHGVMSHSEICQDLDIKESTLSEMMKKINYTQLITFTKSGKYKFYTLTDTGRRLGKELRKQHQKELKEEELLEQLKYGWINSKNQRRLKKEINKLLSNEDENIYSKQISPGDLLQILYYDGQGESKRDIHYVTGIREDLKNDEQKRQVSMMTRKLDYYEEIGQNNINNEEEVRVS